MKGTENKLFDFCVQTTVKQSLQCSVNDNSCTVELLIQGLPDKRPSHCEDIFSEACLFIVLGG